MKPKSDAVVDDLVAAAGGIVPAPKRKSWNHGWAYEDYRRSASAAFDGRDGPVRFTPLALEQWERATWSLIGEQLMQSRWDAESLWALTASLVETASHLGSNQRSFVAESIQRMRTTGPACTLLLMANVTWGADPLVLSDAVIGDAGTELLRSAEANSRGRIFFDDEKREEWLEGQVRPRVDASLTTPVAVCCWTQGQGSLAVEQSSRVLRELVDLPLLLERDLSAFQIYRRGEANRPGVRGLTLDRGAVESGLGKGTYALELASFPLSVTKVMRGGSPVHWYSAEPLPLGRLLAQEHLRDAVVASRGDDPVARRIRLAARWYAEAHYSNESDDSALALGVSLDALLNARQPLPGSAMADRMALLERDPGLRKVARQKYLMYYEVRNAIAHGGRSSKLSDVGFMAAFFGFVCDVAWRLLDMRSTFEPESDAAVDDLFEGLRLGTVTWPAGE